LKPYGIVGHAASASLQGTCGSTLQRRPLCLASTACSTIAQLRANLQPATFHDLVDRRCRNPEQTRRSCILRPARTRTHEELRPFGPLRKSLVRQPQSLQQRQRPETDEQSVVMASRVRVEVLRGDICDSDGRVSVCLLKAPP